MPYARVFVVPLLVCLLVSACTVSPKFETARVDKTVTPAMATQNLASTRGKIVQWGGVIIAGTNRRDSTRLEILAYPLDHQGRPDRDAKSLGRFLADRAGYLETADYAPDRLLTVVGPVTGLQQGRIGETDYTYPLIRVEQLHLWPDILSDKNEPSVHFGIGVGIGVH